MTPHRHLVLSFLLVAAAVTGTHAESDVFPAEFPYKATLASNDVYVRSGPGTEYYPTAKLHSGDNVEVYRHDPGGWCAIRPPSGSFTWISSRFVKRHDAKLGEISGSRVAARVGSLFSPVRDAVQVRLERGELVEILEFSEDGQWMKIAPPSGEFRWIHKKFLVPEHANPGLRRTSAASRPAPTDPFDLSGNSSGSFANDSPNRRVASKFDASVSGLSKYGGPRTRTPEEFSAEMDDLNIELSMMVAEEPTVWEFGDLGMRGERLLAEAQTAVERGRARILLSKIQRFEGIRKRYRELNALAARTERLNRGYTTATPTGALAIDRRSDSSRFDGSGRLIRVRSTDSGAPRFALLDKNGSVRCYVTPAPGVNMQYYLDKEIGVNGMRGYIPEQRAPHVTARHVEELNGGVLR